MTTTPRRVYRDVALRLDPEAVEGIHNEAWFRQAIDLAYQAGWAECADVVGREVSKVLKDRWRVRLNVPPKPPDNWEPADPRRWYP